MDASAFGTAALAALVAIIGLARIAAWVLDRRAHTAEQEAVKARMVAQALVEVRR